MSHVTVRYFALLREKKKTDHEVVVIEDGQSIGALYSQLFPQMSTGGLAVAFARNQEHVQASQPLQDGDEVAFLPPLGGG